MSIIDSRKKLKIPSLIFAFDDQHQYQIKALTLHSAAAYHLKGPNGAGKTTYLKLLSCYLRAQHIIYSYIPTELFWPSELENMPVSETSKMAFFSDLLKHHPQEKSFFMLSSGQKKCCFLATHLNPSSDIWLIDEGWDHLDTTSISLLMNICKDYLKQGGIMIFTAHHEVPQEFQSMIENDIFLDEPYAVAISP